MLGPSGIDRLVIATGHHRNGILLTPVSAAVVSAYILTGTLPEIARPFSPERFAPETVTGDARVAHPASAVEAG
jgi:glycine oxidase